MAPVIPFRASAPEMQWAQTARVRAIANLLAGNEVNGAITEYDRIAALALRSCEAHLREDALTCAEEYAADRYDTLASQLRSCDVTSILARGLIRNHARAIIARYLGHLQASHLCPMMEGYEEPRICRDCGRQIENGDCQCPPEDREE